MTCQELRQKVHEFLDGELAARDLAAFHRHLEECVECQGFHDELDWVKKALSFEAHLSEVAQEQLWKRVKGQVERDFGRRILELWDNFRTFCRDLDGKVWWSKIAAVPVTLAFFAAILVQFPRVDFQQWTYPVIATVSSTSSTVSRLVITQVPVRYARTEINDLMSAVWKIPFEDSLSLVAEIQPEGHAEIGNVLEYPKSQDLLRAIDLALRHSQFQAVSPRDFGNPFVIYSFQKVDVYEDQKGL